MKPNIIALKTKHLVGMKSSMHHNDYASIVTLWQQFMPRKKDIQNVINQECIAVQVYQDFNNLEAAFDIYACVEVSSFNTIPKGMLSLTIPQGIYAVFVHKGMNAAATYQRIMSEWLPNSGYTIDNRPHFQVMGEKYKNGSPDSEEDFYVPIKLI